MYTMKNDQLHAQLDTLKIRGLKERWAEYVLHGGKEEMSHEAFLRHVVTESCRAKSEYGRQMRFSRAAIPEKWVMETYPFAQQPTVNRKRIMNIYDSLDYMNKHQNLIFVGPPGCGKTGLGTSFLIHAIQNNFTACFTTFPDLIGKLYQSLAAHREHRTLKMYAAFDCLLVDELGYVDIEPAQTGLFFRLMSMRHRRRTTIITSNLGFQEWGTFLKNDHLTAALVDRLTENSHVINMKGCPSIRPKGPIEEEAVPARASAAATI